MAEHFTKETTDFLWGLALHNERPWFDAHRADYEAYYKEPMEMLARRTFLALQEKYPDAGFQMKLCRIWRDARRLFGRGPFKEHLWFSIKTDESLESGPMFWFEISAMEYSLGLGYYDAPADLMAYFRRTVDEDPRPLAKLARRLNGQDRFTLDGELYKRSKGDPGRLLAPWYDRKYLALSYESPADDALYDPAFADRLAADFDWLMPYFRYFTALNAGWRRAQERN